MVRCACGTVVFGPVPALVWPGCCLVSSLSSAVTSVFDFWSVGVTISDILTLVFFVCVLLESQQWSPIIAECTEQP